MSDLYCRHGRRIEDECEVCDKEPSWGSSPGSGSKVAYEKIRSYEAKSE